MTDQHSGSRRVQRVAILIAVGTRLIGAPMASSAQESRRCAWNLRAGAAIPAQDLPEAQRSLGLELASGLAFGSGLACPVSNRLLLGGDLEVEWIGDLLLIRVLGSAGVRLTESGWRPRALGVTATGSVGLTGYQAIRDHVTFIPPSGELVDTEGVGFTLGAGIQLDYPVSSRVRLLLDGSWRVAFLSKDRIESGDLIPTSAEALSTFPITVGVRLRL